MRKWLILLFASIFICSTITLVWVLNLETEETLDPDYAISTFSGKMSTYDIQYEAFDALYFLNDVDPLTSFSKKTKFLGATPTLTIVNSDEYRVVITANDDIFGSLKIAPVRYSNNDSTALVITFADDCYVPVHEDDTSYDYDTGLYLDFDKFAVTVYAPISSLHVDSAIVLDYQTPPFEKLYIDFSYEGTEANIYDINTEHLILYCSGTSRLTLSGQVRDTSRISIYHDTIVDATDLVMEHKDFFISSGLLQFSCIKTNRMIHFGWNDAINPLMFGFAALLFLPPAASLIALIGCCFIRRKFRIPS